MADLSQPIPKAPSPHPDSSRLSKAIPRCVPRCRSFTGILYRAACVRRANPEDLVAGVGSLLTGGRWNPLGAFLAVYASLDETTALEEARQQDLRQGVARWMSLPLVVTAIDVDIWPVLDLVDDRIRRILRVPRHQMLAEPWWTIQEEGREAITQTIGRLAREQGFAALLVPSTIDASAGNVVIFPDRLRRTNHVSIVNADRLPAKVT
jgi:RES domain-containing protein